MLDIAGGHGHQNGVQPHSSQGERAAGQGSRAGPVSSVPALTRLCASPHAAQVATEVLRDFQGKPLCFHAALRTICCSGGLHSWIPVCAVSQQARPRPLSPTLALPCQDITYAWLHGENRSQGFPIKTLACRVPATPLSAMVSCAGAVRSGRGVALLQGWSYTADDVAEIEERLQQMASSYDNDDSADAF